MRERTKSIDADWLPGMNSICCITRDRNYSVNNEERKGVSARTRPGESTPHARMQPSSKRSPKEGRIRGTQTRQGATAPEFSLIVEKEEWGFYTKFSKQSLWLYTAT